MKVFSSFCKIIRSNVELRSITNPNRNLAFAHFLPKDWNEKQIKEYFDPKGEFISKVSVVRDRLAKTTGRALIEVTSSEMCKKLIEKHHEQFIDTKEVLQRIAIKEFALKRKQTRADIKRTMKQAYVTGLPKNMTNEEFMELVADFGEVENIQIPKDANADYNKGYAFVLFKRVDDAIQFQTFLQGKDFMGSKLGVQLQNFRFDSQRKSFREKVLSEGDVQYKENKDKYLKLQEFL